MAEEFTTQKSENDRNQIFFLKIHLLNNYQHANDIIILAFVKGKNAYFPE